jgi:hypothetical protein
MRPGAGSPILYMCGIGIATQIHVFEREVSRTRGYPKVNQQIQFRLVRTKLELGLDLIFKT